MRPGPRYHPRWIKVAGTEVLEPDTGRRDAVFERANWRMTFFHSWIGAIGAVLLTSAIAMAADGDSTGQVDFERDILPLVQGQCLDCHGPDSAEANLRLDSMLGFLRGGDSGEPAVVPGASDRSYLIARLRHTDPAKRMPPDAAPLDDSQIELLRAFIDDAPRWTQTREELSKETIDHWAFRPLTRPTPPAISLAGEAQATPSNPIDGFIARELERAGLRGSPPAERATLIRRLYLVMHGLPPTPAEVDEFVNDPRGDAWELLVEQVLASPRYGERIATHWLDLVRFGETNGFETNRERPSAWRYRDWVIAAFNDDKPYDQFVVEQLAGDAVGADVATGFLVGGPYDLVKGQDPLLQLVQRQDELADMINTTGTAFLGLTLGCARCHNHKFDPVTQTDYYALQAVFAGVQHGERPLPPDAQTAQRIAELDLQIAELRRSLQPFLQRPRGLVASEGAADQDVPLREPVNARLNIESLTPTDVRYVKFTILATNQGEPCLDELELLAAGQNVALTTAGAKASSSGDFVHPLHKLEHLNDGRYGNAHSWIANQPSAGWVQIELPEVHRIEAIRWGRDRDGGFADRLATDYRIDGSVDGVNWVLLASAADRRPFTPGQPAQPVYDFDSFPAEQAAAGRQLLQQFEERTAERDRLAQTLMSYAGNFTQPGPTYRLYRGEPTAAREQVVPGAIQALTPWTLPAEAPEQQRRLALAHWIADEGNPLTARVIVNRIWQFHFGTGIVDTPSDFGGNGTAPTHPELLDWLASELIRSGWSIKHLQRLILNSQTWTQQSRPREDALRIDAGSRLLWRFPPRRLEAEAIRDSMLAASGTLDPRVGGAGFSSFEVALENVRHYFPKTEFGPEDWRRMIYMTRVRQERDAVFGVFDCPDFNQVVPKRGRSTTPLQALNLLNSSFVLQQAELLVARLQREAETPEGRIDLAHRLCFNRPAAADEIGLALEFIEHTDWPSFARAMLNANEFVQIP